MTQTMWEIEEQKRKEEAARINGRKVATIDEVVPVFRDGEPFAIIEDQYVPWPEAQVMLKEAAVERAQDDLRRAKEEYQEFLDKGSKY